MVTYLSHSKPNLSYIVIYVPSIIHPTWSLQCINTSYLCVNCSVNDITISSYIYIVNKLNQCPEIWFHKFLCPFRGGWCTFKLEYYSNVYSSFLLITYL